MDLKSPLNRTADARGNAGAPGAADMPLAKTESLAAGVAAVAAVFLNLEGRRAAREEELLKGSLGLHRYLGLWGPLWF